MRILAIEPCWGGSHQAFIEGWRARSRHDWTLLTLPPHQWKWRMRHSALTCARLAAAALKESGGWDVLLASEMLDLAQFCGLAPAAVAALPRVAFYHENRLLYPARRDEKRDPNFAYINFTSCLAAGSVWFNTAWHRLAFLEALEGFLRRMPDYGHYEEVEAIRKRSLVIPQGIDPPPARPPRREGPLRIVWAARWDYEKNPGDLYGALKLLREGGIEFQISVIGGEGTEIPVAFRLIEDEFRDRILRWGYQSPRAEYYAALNEADVFVSTSEKEFFGVSLLEAAACGTVPLAPERLAYPEVLRGHDDFLYNGTARGLAARLSACAGQINTPEWPKLQDLARQLGTRFCWDVLAPRYDDQIVEAASCAH